MTSDMDKPSNEKVRKASELIHFLVAGSADPIEEIYARWERYEDKDAFALALVYELLVMRKRLLAYAQAKRS